MEIRKLRHSFLLLLYAGLSVTAAAQPARRQPASLPTNALLKIVRYEDQRSWNDDLRALLSDGNVNIRQRAALAAGRIGDDRAIASLTAVLRTDSNANVRQMAAFSLGEIESAAGADALLETLAGTGRTPEANGAVRARAVEALGKISAALPETDKDRRKIYGEAILKALRFEDDRRSHADQLSILLGLIAVLRARPDNAGEVVARFLDYSDPQIIATALNTMARLRLKDRNERVRALLNHADPIVRAHAA